MRLIDFIIFCYVTLLVMLGAERLADILVGGKL
jgi:hypothetical protein